MALLKVQLILNFNQHNGFVEVSIKVSLKSPLVVRQEVERWLADEAGWDRIPGGVPGSGVVVNPFSRVGLYLSKMGDRFNIASCELIKRVLKKNDKYSKRALEWPLV